MNAAENDFDEPSSAEYKHATSLVVISMLLIGDTVENVDNHPLFGKNSSYDSFQTKLYWKSTICKLNEWNQLCKFPLYF